jgi:hypothetical protein
MDPGRIATMRLASQQLANPRFTAVRNAVAWMGAMQAQDSAMAQWAIGARLAQSTASGVQAAIDCGEIIRTHLLRPTWHIVAAEDVRWILELTAPHINASVNATHKALELTASAVSRTNSLLEKSLIGGRHLTRDEVLAIFRKARIPVGGYRAAHILLRAELDAVICSGPARDGKQTYALLDERVQGGKRLSGDRALKELAERYFTSRSPATLEDFMWWSGLRIAAARRAMELTDSTFASATIDSRAYRIARGGARQARLTHSVYVLPAFDEFLISYRDRSAVLPPGPYANVVSSNGIFRPVIVSGGQVSGLWKRTMANDDVKIEAWLFGKSARSMRKSIEKAFARYARFTEKKTHLAFRGETRIILLR